MATDDPLMAPNTVQAPSIPAPVRRGCGEKSACGFEEVARHAGHSANAPIRMNSGMTESV